jgi:cell division protein FtsQ
MTARMIGTRRSTIMNKRRKGAIAVVIPWLRRFGILIAAAIVLMWIGGMMIVTGGAQNFAATLHKSFVDISANVGFRVGNVMVEGRARSDAKKLMELIGVERGSPLFAFDPDEVRARIEIIQWVRRAKVERRLPDTIYIRIFEHVPIAFWQNNKKLILLGESGEVINDNRISDFNNLLIVIGKDAPLHAPDLIKALNDAPTIAAMAESARWMDGRRWDLILKNKITVLLPEDNIKPAMDRLMKAQDDSKILDRAITEIDLRMPDRMTVRTVPGAVEQYRAAVQKSGDPI